jgi:hypothetical protein
MSLLLDPVDTARERPSRVRRPSAPALLAVLAGALCAALVLARHSALLEPDDFAYRASVAALRHGEIVLTSAQYRALAASLPGGIVQWHHLASGFWISEKNPGYPFMTVVFYALGALRLAPLAFGAVAAGALYLGGRAWLGRWGGTVAVWLFLFSGAALTFAWRDTMPTFIDASLVATGTGLLLYALWSREAPPHRRVAATVAAMIALELATFVRYTDVVELAVALAVVVILARPTQLPRRAVVISLATVGATAAGIMAFDAWAYGHATSTGYSAGEITFSLSALGPNLATMPSQLLRAMPVWLLGAVGVALLVARAASPRLGADRPAARRDLVAGLALAAGWIALWGLYLAYTWTVHAAGAGATVHVVRFYLPALGPIALLGAWVLTRRPRLLAPVTLCAVVATAVLSFSSMAHGGPGLGGARTGAPPGAPGSRPPGAAPVGAGPGSTGRSPATPPLGSGPRPMPRGSNGAPGANR